MGTIPMDAGSRRQQALLHFVQFAVVQCQPAGGGGDRLRAVCDDHARQPKRLDRGGDLALGGDVEVRGALVHE
jgi:hypothetical protein